MDGAGHRDQGTLLADLGTRIRVARKAAGLTLKALAAAAEISERYLAQIESGQGNISVALLARVADALGRPLPDLVDPDPLAARIRAADPEIRKRIDRLTGETARCDGRVALIGLRGAGKSTLGPLAARKLGLPFHELNDLIAEAAGMSVTEVFALYGQEGYRRLEREALERLTDGPPMILAVAGGLVSEPDTYERLLERFHTIWLKARPEQHMERVRAQGDERPMAGNPTAMADLRSILTRREAVYARADAIVDTSAGTLRDSLEGLLRAIAQA